MFFLPVLFQLGLGDGRSGPSLFHHGRFPFFIILTPLLVFLPAMAPRSLCLLLTLFFTCHTGLFRGEIPLHHASLFIFILRDSDAFCLTLIVKVIQTGIVVVFLFNSLIVFNQFCLHGVTEGLAPLQFHVSRRIMFRSAGKLPVPHHANDSYRNESCEW